MTHDPTDDLAMKLKDQGTALQIAKHATRRTAGLGLTMDCNRSMAVVGCCVGCCPCFRPVMQGCPQCMVGRMSYVTQLVIDPVLVCILWWVLVSCGVLSGGVCHNAAILSMFLYTQLK